MEVDINFSKGQQVSLVNNAYLSIISDFGAMPVIISNFPNAIDADAIARKFDGLLLIGGEDIVDTSVEKKETASNRDIVEKQLYYEFKERKKPIMGICRGMQLINVAEGGELYSELPETQVRHYIEKDGWINYHNINIKNNTKIHTILKKEQSCISSVHHQGVRILGKNLQVSANAEDGLPEIIESVDNSAFIIGIQGHPEKIRKNFPEYNLIFKEFVEEASKNE